MGEGCGWSGQVGVVEVGVRTPFRGDKRRMRGKVLMISYKRKFGFKFYLGMLLELYCLPLEALSKKIDKQFRKYKTKKKNTSQI